MKVIEKEHYIDCLSVYQDATYASFLDILMQKKVQELNEDQMLYFIMNC